MIAFLCSGCGKSLKVKDEAAGRRGRCPHCQQPMTVPVAANRDPADRDRQQVLDAETVLPPFLDANRETVTFLPAVPRGATELKDVNTQGSGEGADAELYDFLAPPQSADEIGRLGPYRVLKVLGAGGMGVVFLAEDPRLGRLVALKAMLPALAASGTNKERFLREARTAAAVEHDRIVAIFQVDEDRGVPFIAMPFLRGESLEDRLKRERKLPMAEVLRIGKETAEGLAAAHAKGLIHRDIKPANLWLEGDKGRVKILDFGLARSASSEAKLTQLGAILGTPAYMAPEQGAGKPVDPRCDLFSLGCMLYRMATGKLPFKGIDLASMLHAVATQTPPAPHELDPELSPRVSKLIVDLLAKDANERPATAESVVRLIEELEHAPPALCGVDEPQLQEKRLARSRLMLPLLLGSIGLLSLAMFIVNIVLFVRKPVATVMVPNDDTLAPDSVKERRPRPPEEDKPTPPPQKNDPPPVANAPEAEPKRDPGRDDAPLVPPKPLAKVAPPVRRAPSIKNIDEAAVAFVRVAVDMYIFSQNFDRIMVLQAQAGGPANAGNGGGRKLGDMFKGVQPPGMGGGMAMQRQVGQFRNLNARGVQAADGKKDYDTRFVKLADADLNSAHLARQLQPARMALIAGSFPYKAQLDEFMSKLRLPSIKAVLGETVGEGADKLPAFRFLGVRVQRQERDAKGEVVSDWNDLNIADVYKLWMLHSGLLFEPDDPKYEAIKPLFPGLVMPRLRAFHEESPQNPMPMGPSVPGAQPPREVDKSTYPDVEGQLKAIQFTLEKLADASRKQNAAPPPKFRPDFDPFNPKAPAASKGDKAAPEPAKDVAIPEHCLVRLIDVTIEPGKFYRYRLKIKMANPNYNKPNMAVPADQLAKELMSENWYELPQTVSVPPELFYYVVDQKYVKRADGPTGGEKHQYGSPLSDMWIEPTDRDRKAAFQFQRWVESTPLVPGGEPVPIGDWVVADRVFVARGEYVGQLVRVDLPVWKYTRDSFVLPTKVQRKGGNRMLTTGVNVNFDQDNPDRETILVDFEGGRCFFEQRAPTAEGAVKPIRIEDTSAVEVLLLSAEGKLLARNSAADTKDEDRQRRRAKYHARIREVKDKAAGLVGGKGDDLFGK